MIHLIEPEQPPKPTRLRKGRPKGIATWSANYRMRKFFANFPEMILSVDEATKVFGIKRAGTASRLSNLVKEGVLERVNGYRLKKPLAP